MPTANFVVEYTAKLTYKKLVGNSKVACELSSRTHGATEWWVLVEKEKKGEERGRFWAKRRSQLRPLELHAAWTWGKGRGKGRA